MVHRTQGFRIRRRHRQRPHTRNGSGELINGRVDGQPEDDSEDDVSAGIGFSIGRRVGAWSIALDYLYRYRTDWDIAAQAPSINTVTNVFTDVETNLLLMSVARRGRISTRWS